MRCPTMYIPLYIHPACCYTQLCSLHPRARKIIPGDDYRGIPTGARVKIWQVRRKISSEREKFDLEQLDQGASGHDWNPESWRGCCSTKRACNAHRWRSMQRASRIFLANPQGNFQAEFNTWTRRTVYDNRVRDILSMPRKKLEQSEEKWTDRWVKKKNTEEWKIKSNFARTENQSKQI